MDWNRSYNIFYSSNICQHVCQCKCFVDTPDRKTYRKHLICFYEARERSGRCSSSSIVREEPFELSSLETVGQLGENNIRDICHHRENITSALLRWNKSAKLLPAVTSIITIKQMHSRGHVVVVKSLIIRSVWAYNTYFITPLQIQQDVKMIRDNNILSSGLHFLISHAN